MPDPPMQQNHDVSDHLSPCYRLPVTHSAEASPDRIIADVLHRKKAAQTAARPFSAVTPRNSLPMHKRTNDGRRRSPDTDPGGAPLGKGSQRMSFIAANVYSIDLNALSPVSGTSGQVCPPPPPLPPFSLPGLQNYLLGMSVLVCCVLRSRRL